MSNSSVDQSNFGRRYKYIFQYKCKYCIVLNITDWRIFVQNKVFDKVDDLTSGRREHEIRSHIKKIFQ